MNARITTSEPRGLKERGWSAAVSAFMAARFAVGCALLTAWGFAASAGDVALGNRSGAGVVRDGEATTKHWAYQPLSRPEPPAMTDKSWARGTLDSFVGARLEAEGLKPAADADPHSWLRRVSLDLTGLPPTPEEIAAFVADASAAARERVVDRLLASNAFGERWARHWLDLVGYADQLGTVNDVPAPHAWRYRDYVIRAFQSDKPFDRFVREQVAGDLLPDSDPATRQEAWVATGFLLLGEIHIVTGDKVQLRADIMDHQIQKVGLSFLGQSLGCARCHDHKFDPIRQDDYYGLAGIFGSTESSYVTDRGVWSSVLSVELPETEAQRAERERTWGEHLVRVEKMKAERAELTRQIAALQRATTNAIPASGAAPSAGEAKEKKADLERRISAIDGRLLHLAYLEPRAAWAHGVRDASQAADEPVHQRGNPRAPGRIVPRGFVRALDAVPWPRIPGGASGRLELADWIVDPRNPLTARVTVNRIWQKMFGEGLVRTVDNFGTRGERPSHPELLDWLAGEFMRRGWSQKRLIREIALSRTYGLSSVRDPALAARDPDNRLLGRAMPRRLDAEALRDAMLAVTGELKPTTGGPALALHLPENIGGLDPKDPNPVSFRTSVIPEDQPRHRTVYLPVVRSRAQPGSAELREFFDFVPPTAMCGQRPSTSVATQALFLMNSEFMKARAARLAEALLRENAPDRRARLVRLYLRALGRPVSDGDIERADRFLASAGEAEAGRQREAWAEFCHALLSSNEFVFEL